MKRVLITGGRTSGYVGTNLVRWLERWPDRYSVEALSVRGDDWYEHDFSTYDTVVHCAALVHESERNHKQEEYDEINAVLPVAVAKKAKQQGVSQFVFMSTIAVHGLIGRVGKSVVIDEFTPALPVTMYGKSKLAAEIVLRELEDENFSVAILRPPMIYGPNCPGNYAQLRRLVLRLHLVPQVDNARSMVYILNLCELLRMVIEGTCGGVFFPQDSDTISTAQMMTAIARSHHTWAARSGLVGLGVRVLGSTSVARKAFGSLIIEAGLSQHFDGAYRVLGACEAVDETENRWN